MSVRDATLQRLDDLGKALELVVHQMAQLLPPPTYDAPATPERWDFGDQTREVALVCLSAKAVSSLDAAVHLWVNRHLHETWAILRSVIECCDDLTLLSVPTEDDSLDDVRARKLKEFFHDGIAAPIAQWTKPAMVARNEIAAKLGNLMHKLSGVANPHDAINGYKRLHQVHSSYVHGNYRSAMALVSGIPGSGFRFAVLGSGDEREAGELLEVLSAYAEMTRSSIEMAAIAMDARDAVRTCRAACRAFKAA